MRYADRIKSGLCNQEITLFQLMNKYFEMVWVVSVQDHIFPGSSQSKMSLHFLKNGFYGERTT